MPAEINDALRQFIGQQTHFYMGSADGKGRPYIQHRGGPAGFLKVMDNRTLGFADYAGNRRYVTVGNLGENPHVFLFLMDYPAQRRIKIRGRGRIETDPAVIRSLAPDNYDAIVERAIVIEVEHWETNCNAHIRQRFTVEQVTEAVAPLQARIEMLEAKLAAAGIASD